MPQATPWIERFFTAPQDSFEISIHFPQGCRKINKQSGQSYRMNIFFLVQLQYTDVPLAQRIWMPIAGIDVGGTYKDGFTVTEKYVGTSAAQVNPAVFNISYDRTRPFGIRIRRNTLQVTAENENPDDSYAYSYVSILQSIVGFKNISPTVDPPGTQIAKTALSVLATKQLNGQIEGINALVQTYCLDWNPSVFGSPGEWLLNNTNNPASLFLYVLTHPGNPQRIKSEDVNSRIDLPKLQYWHQYCAQNRIITNGNGTVYAYRFEYNNVLANVRSILEVLRDICAAGRASPALVDGKWSVNIDEPKTVVQHFTPHNSWGFESTKALPRIPDGLKIRFFNEALNFKEDEVIVYNYGYGEKNETINGVDIVAASLFESITLPGVTNVGQIIDHGKWHFAQIKLRPEIYTLNTDTEYLVCNRGDRVKVAHDVPMWGLGSGRIKNRFKNGVLNNSTGIQASCFELDEPISIDASHTGGYTLRIRSSTGSSVAPTLKTTFTVSSYSYIGSSVTLDLNSSDHPIRVGNTISVVVAASNVNMTAAVVTQVNGSQIKYTKPGLTGSTQTISVPGEVKLASGSYDLIQLNTELLYSQCAPLDLFLFGQLNKESTDLIVLSIEPTSGAKNARLTLVDYGVTDTYNIFTDYKDLTLVNYDTNITQPVVAYREFFGSMVPTILSSEIISDDRAIKSLSPGTYSSGMLVPFTNPSEAIGLVSPEFVEAEYFRYTQSHPVPIRVEKVPSQEGVIYIPDLDKGVRYIVRLRYVSSSGIYGMWTDAVEHTVIGKLFPPDNVINFTYVKKETGIEFSWNPSTTADYKSTVIRVLDNSLAGTNINTNWTNAQAETLFEGSASSYLWNRPPSGSYLVMVAHKNTLDVYSLTIYSVVVEYSSLSFNVVRAELSNDTHQIPVTESTGAAVPFLALSGTKIYVYEGNDLLKYDATGLQNSRWRITTKTDTNVVSGAIQLVLNTTDGDDYATVADLQSITGDLGNTQFLIEGKNSLGQEFSFIKTQYFTVQSAGINPVVYAIESSTPVVYKASPDAATPGKFSAISGRGVRIEGDNPAELYGWLGITPYTLNVLGQEVAGTEGFVYQQIINQIPADNDQAVKWVVKLYDIVPGSTTNPPQRGTTVLDTEEVQVVFEGESYYLEIESTQGTIFRPGQSSSTLLKAKVFKNGLEVTDTIDASHFKWRRVSQDTVADATWNTSYQSGYKQVLIDVDDVDARATFFCDIVTP